MALFKHTQVPPICLRAVHEQSAIVACAKSPWPSPHTFPVCKPGLKAPVKAPPFLLKNACGAEAVPRCQEGLMRFYCSTAQQRKLQGDSGAWREGALDEVLCRAGLWCALL